MSKFIKVTDHYKFMSTDPYKKRPVLINTECIIAVSRVDRDMDELYSVCVGDNCIKVDAQDAQRIFNIIGISL